MVLMTIMKFDHHYPMRAGCNVRNTLDLRTYCKRGHYFSCEGTGTGAPSRESAPRVTLLELSSKDCHKRGPNASSCV